MFKWQYAAPWWKQLYVLAERNVMALIQNPVAFLQSAVSYILIALIMGALFSNLVSNVYVCSYSQIFIPVIYINE